jgi:hypothetical protein
MKTLLEKFAEINGLIIREMQLINPKGFMVAEITPIKDKFHIFIPFGNGLCTELYASSETDLCEKLSRYKLV